MNAAKAMVTTDRMLTNLGRNLGVMLISVKLLGVSISSNVPFVRRLFVEKFCGFLAQLL